MYRITFNLDELSWTFYWMHDFNLTELSTGWLLDDFKLAELSTGTRTTLNSVELSTE